MPAHCRSKRRPGSRCPEDRTIQRDLELLACFISSLRLNGPRPAIIMHFSAEMNIVAHETCDLIRELQIAWVPCCPMAASAPRTLATRAVFPAAPVGNGGPSPEGRSRALRIVALRSTLRHKKRAPAGLALVNVLATSGVSVGAVLRPAFSAAAARMPCPRRRTSCRKRCSR